MSNFHTREFYNTKFRHCYAAQRSRTMKKDKNTRIRTSIDSSPQTNKRKQRWIGFSPSGQIPRRLPCMVDCAKGAFLNFFLFCFPPVFYFILILAEWEWVNSMPRTTTNRIFSTWKAVSTRENPAVTGGTILGFTVIFPPFRVTAIAVPECRSFSFPHVAAGDGAVAAADYDYDLDNNAMLSSLFSFRESMRFSLSVCTGVPQNRPTATAPHPYRTWLSGWWFVVCMPAILSHNSFGPWCEMHMCFLLLPHGWCTHDWCSQQHRCRR